MTCTHKWREVYYAAKIALGGRGHQKLFPEYMPAQPGIALGVRELDLGGLLDHDVNDCRSFLVRLPVRDVVQLSR